jgi:hypothetical protein
MTFIVVGNPVGVGTEHTTDGALGCSWHCGDDSGVALVLSDSTRFQSPIFAEQSLTAVTHNLSSHGHNTRSTQQLRHSLSPPRHRTRESAASRFQRVITQLNADVGNFSKLDVVARRKVRASDRSLFCVVCMHSEKIICSSNACPCNVTGRNDLANYAKEGNWVVIADASNSKSPNCQRGVLQAVSA